MQEQYIKTVYYKMSEGVIISGIFVKATTEKISYGTRTYLYFKDIHDKDGNKIGKIGVMKKSAMGELVWFKRDVRYVFKINEAVVRSFIPAPVMIECPEGIRYSIKNSNSIMQEVRGAKHVHVTENYTAVDRRKKRYTKPLSEW